MQDDLTTLDDAVLAARMAEGDEQAVAVLYDRYATPAFSLALKVAGDPQRAADVVQRAFTRVWEDARQFDPRAGRFASWLLSIVNYLALSPAPRPVPVPVVAPRSRSAPWCPPRLSGGRAGGD
jgi:RNA polymerase sigma-70 factor (ECF subfamily)